jgi:iron complex outermembrane receptor protein
MGITNVKRSLKAALLAGGVLAIAAPAFAQDNVTTLEDIVVTAQRRSERLQDVPISITALSSAALDRSGVTSTQDLARVTPGLSFPVNGGYIQPTIRGISSEGSNIGDSSNVALYVDGVYQPAQASQLMDLPDVSQVEVLKGPQGTLYGQNAMGGAIIITTQAPSFTPTGKLSASYGNYNDINLRGFVSGPIVGDVLAASLSAAYQDRDGFRHDLVYGGRDKGLRSKQVRAKLLFTPSDDAKVTASAYWTKRGDTALYSGQPLDGNSTGYAFYPNAPRARSPKDTVIGSQGDDQFETWGGSIRGEFDVGLGTFNTITGYTNAHIKNYADVDYSPVNIAVAAPVLQKTHSFTEELNFVSKKMSGWQFTTGLFFMSSEDSFLPSQFVLSSLGIPGLVPTLAPAAPGPTALALQSNGTLKKEIYAGYAEVTYDLTDKLVVSAGGRYSYEKQTALSNANGGNVVGSPLYTLQLTETPYSPDAFKKFTPRVTVRYAVDPNSNIYGTYSKGFKSGLVSTLDFTNPPVKPEDLTAIEVGYKGRPLPGVSLNISAFHYTYKNKQVAHYEAPNYIYQNAASARVKGVEADLSWAATHGLTLSATASYLDGKYKKFTGASSTVSTGFGDLNVPIDASGLRMIRTPKFTGTLAANYEVETDMGKFGAYASVYYNDGFKWEVSGRIREKAHTTLDGELSYSPASLENMRLVLWGKNLTDVDIKQSVLTSDFGDGVSYAPPRTFGVRAEYKF